MRDPDPVCYLCQWPWDALGDPWYAWDDDKQCHVVCRERQDEDDTNDEVE